MMIQEEIELFETQVVYNPKQKDKYAANDKQLIYDKLYQQKSFKRKNKVPMHD